MKIKLTALACLMFSLVSSSTLLTAAMATPATKSYDYLPITDYQRALSSMMCNFIPSCFSTKTEVTKAPVVKEETIVALSPRESALEGIKTVTTKIFDIDDEEDISSHFLAMKELTEYLDQELDKKTISAIHFLLENQHRSSPGAVDTAFWWRANTQHNFLKTIPMTPEVATNKTNVATLRKKLALQTEKLKKDQSNDQSLVIPEYA